MPLPDIGSASPRYRIKSIAEKHDRIVPENELSLPKVVSSEIQVAHEDMQLPRVDN